MKKIFLVFILLLWTVQSMAQPLSQDNAIQQMRAWMNGHRIMGHLVEAPLKSVQTFSSTTNDYFVYIAQFEPSGYVILNSDDQLPLIITFSADTTLNLDNTPDNALLSLLTQMVNRTIIPVAKKTLSAQKEMTPPESELYGPFLTTTWNQTHPYNAHCPSYPGGSVEYGYRAPSGCVPTAYAQILAFHRWPVTGRGFHTYTDSIGSMTGQHTAVFSDPYDWPSMKNAHNNSLGSESQSVVDSVAELMKELGIAVEANFEGEETSSNTALLGSRLNDYFYYEPCTEIYTLTNLIAAMEADLRKGLPSVISIPGHAVVADGLMTENGVTTYHFNYGWGGVNNGWWSANNIAGSAMEDGVTSLRPQLLAIPSAATRTATNNAPVDLTWTLPRTREAEVTALSLYRLTSVAGAWNTNANQMTAVTASGWSSVSGGRNGGNCWFAGPYGPAPMLLNESYIPDTNTFLRFWTYFRLGTATFSASISTNDGVSFTQLYSENSRYFSTWEQKSISLSAYAGKPVRIRLNLSSGSYYPDVGGVWVDDLSFSAGALQTWTPYATNLVLTAQRYSAVTSEWDNANNFSQFEITSTSTNTDWIITNTTLIGSNFFKKAGGYSNHKYHLTSLSTITPTSSTELLLHAKYRLATDKFRISVSTNRTTFTSIWESSGSTIDWSQLAIPLTTYAGKAIYIRLEYVPGSYYSDGGIWINAIRTQTVTNAHLFGQPEHHTLFTPTQTGTVTLAAVLTGTSNKLHPISPSFQLTVAGASDDGDGIPSEWEILYGLNPAIDDAGLDPDGDGYSNLQEYICGTHPTNATSAFLLQHNPTNGPSFHTQIGSLYTILLNTNLTTTNWTPVAVDIPGSNVLIQIQQYDSLSRTSAFYRVRVRKN